MLAGLIYFFSSPGPTHHNYYYLLAQAFFKGHLYLEANPVWLNELVPYNGKFFVVYPPIPAILLALSLGFINQTLLSIILGGLSAALFYLLCQKLKLAFQKTLWLTILFSFGTNFWYTACIGSAWYFAHIVAVFFQLLSLNEFWGKRRMFLVGLLVGASYWARLPTILTAFYFLAMLMIEKNQVKNIIKLCSGIGIFVLLNFAYNYYRFGTIQDIGYQLIPGVLQEPWYSRGIFHYSYIPRSLGFVLFKLPVFSSQWPYVFPSLEGMSLFLTTPAFLLLLKTNLKNKQQLILFVTIILLSLPSLAHGTVGFSQFGYRFSLDFLVFMFLLLIQVTGKKLSFLAKSLIVLSILINCWGVVMLNFFKIARW